MSLFQPFFKLHFICTKDSNIFIQASSCQFYSQKPISKIMTTSFQFHKLISWQWYHQLLTTSTSFSILTCHLQNKSFSYPRHLANLTYILVLQFTLLWPFHQLILTSINASKSHWHMSVTNTSFNINSVPNSKIPFQTWNTPENLHSLERAEGIMVRWVCGVSLKDRKRSEVL